MSELTEVIKGDIESKNSPVCPRCEEVLGGWTNGMVNGPRVKASYRQICKNCHQIFMTVVVKAEYTLFNTLVDTRITRGE